MSAEIGMAAAAGLVVLAVLASKASARLGVPALVLFIGVGMLAGSEGFGRIDFDDAVVAHDVGILALACILFAGGLATPWADARRVAPKGLSLATVGVAVTAGVTGVAASRVLGLPLLTGLLVGATVSSTDAAAVFSVLRSRALRLKGDALALLEVESGSNDPMAVVLTIGLIDVIQQPSTSVVSLLGLLARQLVIGAAGGVAMSRLTVLMVNRLRLSSDGLYPVLTLAMVVLTFGLTATLGGSGFLAVYIAGLALGRADYLHKRSLTRFHDAIAWLAQIAMFLVLGLLVFPSKVVAEAWGALAVCAVLVFVARPVAVALSLAPFRPHPREVLFVSWVGLRGAVPIVIATFPLVAGVAGAQRIFDVVFFIVLTSLLLQSSTIAFVARRLGMVGPPPQEPAAIPVLDLHELQLRDLSPASGRRLVDLELPPGALVVLVRRATGLVVPEGSTELRPGDTVVVLAGADDLAAVRAQVEGYR